MQRIIIAIIACAVVLPAAAAADTLVAVLEPVSLAEPNEFDLGGIVTGITDVTMRVTGIGGARCYNCEDIDGENHQVLFEFEYDVTMDDASLAMFRPGIGDYEFDVDVVLLPGVPDWSSLEDGWATLTVQYDTYEYISPQCTPGLFCSTSPEMHRIELMITADSVVPAAATTWSRLKAIYR